MIHLVRAELNRLRSRRLAWVACVLLLLALAGLQLIVYQTVAPLSQSEISQARVDYEQAKEDYPQTQECLDEGESPEACAPELTPEDFQREQLPLGEVGPYVVTTAFYFTAFALALVAASVIGAEYATGALANWLTFVPNRTKVLTAKLLAVVLGSALVAAVALAGTVAVATAVTRWSGAAVSGVDRLWEQAARGTVLVLVLAVLGFVVALLTRHTVGAVGALVAYLLLSSVLSFLVEVVSGLGWLKPLLPQSNISAFLNNGYSYPEPGSMLDESSSAEPRMLTITFGESAVYWVVVLAAALALAFVVFRRRDVN